MVSRYVVRIILISILNNLIRDVVQIDNQRYVKDVRIPVHGVIRVGYRFRDLLRTIGNYYII